MESFPIKFCRGIRSHWRSRKYQKLRSSAAGDKTGRVVRFGGGGGRGTFRRFKLRPAFRIRLGIFSPLRILARIRDAYVDTMLGVAGKSALGGSSGPELLLGRRIPKARPVKPEAGEFEKKLIMEIYKSVMSSREFAAIA